MKRRRRFKSHHAISKSQVNTIMRTGYDVSKDSGVSHVVVTRPGNMDTWARLYRDVCVEDARFVLNLIDRENLDLEGIERGVLTVTISDLMEKNDMLARMFEVCPQRVISALALAVNQVLCEQNHEEKMRVGHGGLDISSSAQRIFLRIIRYGSLTSTQNISTNMLDKWVNLEGLVISFGGLSISGFPYSNKKPTEFNSIEVCRYIRVQCLTQPIGNENRVCIDCRFNEQSRGRVTLGDSIRVGGILRHENRIRDSEQLKFYLDVSYIESIGGMHFSESDMGEILRLSKVKNIAHLFMDSVFKKTYINETVKLSLILSLFSFEEETLSTLLVMDPISRKENILQRLSVFKDRSFYCDVAAQKGMGPSELFYWGCLSASGSPLLLDNIDHFRDTSLLGDFFAFTRRLGLKVSGSSMVSVRSVCGAMICSCDSVFGHFNYSKRFTENVKLSKDFLRSMCLVFVLVDECNGKRDSILYKSIVNESSSSKHEEEDGVYSTELLKKYICYSRRICPIVSNEIIDEILLYFMDISDQMFVEDISLCLKDFGTIFHLCILHARLGLKKRYLPRIYMVPFVYSHIVFRHMFDHLPITNLQRVNLEAESQNV